MSSRQALRKEAAISSQAEFFFSSRRRHTSLQGDWSSDVCSSDLMPSTNPGTATEFGPSTSAPAKIGGAPSANQVASLVLHAIRFQPLLARLRLPPRSSPSRPCPPTHKELLSHSF